MPKHEFIYDIDDLPPLRHTLVYGLQWTIITFPALIIVAALAAKATGMDIPQQVRFLQLTLIASGFFTILQCLWGHRYPLLDGPATALLLTFIVLAPFGIAAIQGGTIFGGALLLAIVAVGKLKKLTAFFTPNVVGVILMLIALTLLPHLIRLLSGVNEDRPAGAPAVFLTGITLTLLMAALSNWLSGFLKTISLLLGILLGTIIFSFVQFPNLEDLRSAAWFSVPGDWVPSRPQLFWPAMAACALSYVAVIVNSVGSIHGIANVTDQNRLGAGISRGIFLNGAAGVLCGFMGIVGMVSYSISPGVVLANRVASRYSTVACGAILMIAALVPKLAALLALIPGPVIGAALCVAMGAQIGAAFSVICTDGIGHRDYFVVGLPVLIGTMVGFLPAPFMDSVSVSIRVFLGNGLIVGIVLVLLLEHIVLRRRAV